MSDDKLKNILSVLPDEDEIRSRAARARQRALARLDHAAPVVETRISWIPSLAMAALVLLVAGIVYQIRPPASPGPVASSSGAAEREQERLRMKWVLRDGTRVLWTFNRSSNL